MAKKINHLMVLVAAIIFLGGAYYYTIWKPPSKLEALSNMSGSVRCPNVLIQKGPKYFLYNSNVAQVPGVNPIEFNSLEDYNEFLDWQRSAGIRCPVLYVQNTYNAQGDRVYKIRPSVNELQGGLPPAPPVSNPVKFTKLVDAGVQDAPYNKNQYPGFDTTSYYVGSTTPLDQMNHTEKNLLYSDDAMDGNWGGAAYTQTLVDRGYYKNNNVSIQVAD